MSISLLNLRNAYLNTKSDSKINNANLTNSTSNSSNIISDDKANLAFEQIYSMMIANMLSSNYDENMASMLSNIGTSGSEEGNPLDILQYMSQSRMSLQGYNPNENSISTNSTSNLDNDLGSLSSKYESNSNPGDISNNAGDYGGKSYGAWQFSANTGSLNSFMGWLKGTNYNYYQKLTTAKQADGNSYGTNFDSAWKQIASTDSSGFMSLQKGYVKTAFFDAAADKLKEKYGFDINSRDPVLKDVLWSTVVQHGVGGAVSIFSKVNLKEGDSQLIKDIYGEREKVNTYFKSSSESIRKSVYNRFEREKKEALSMLQAQGK